MREVVLFFPPDGGFATNGSKILSAFLEKGWGWEYRKLFLRDQHAELFAERFSGRKELAAVDGDFAGSASFKNFLIDLERAGLVEHGLFGNGADGDGQIGRVFFVFEIIEFLIEEKFQTAQLQLIEGKAVSGSIK